MLLQLCISTKYTECEPEPEGGIGMTYTVIYEQGPTSWGAYVPDRPGVISVGQSREEVECMIREAIEVSH